MPLEVIAVGIVQVPDDCDDPVVILRGTKEDVREAARLFGDKVDLYRRKVDEPEE